MPIALGNKGGEFVVPERGWKVPERVYRCIFADDTGPSTSSSMKSNLILLPPFCLLRFQKF